MVGFTTRSQIAALAAAAAMLEAGATFMPIPRDNGKHRRPKYRKPTNHVARARKTFKLKGIRP